MKKFIIVVSLTISFSIIQGQSMAEFSQDTGKFISELDVIFGTSLTEAEAAAFNSFKQNWQSLDYSEQTEIMELCELKRVKRFKAKPYFINFIIILNSFQQDVANIDRGYSDWMKGYRILLENKDLVLKEMNSFQTGTIQLLGSNMLSSSRTSSWKARGSDIKFRLTDSLRAEITGGDLVCTSRDDSITIYEIAGEFDPMKMIFKGTRGIVRWEKAGFDPQKTYAELSTYSLKTYEPGFNAENVKFTHADLFDQAVTGTLEDKVSFAKSVAQVKYPKFYTYESTFSLKDFAPGINYIGGISMQGAHLAGTGPENQDALLTIFKDDTLRVKIGCQVFLFGPSVITAEHAEVSIYIEQDSIYHPDVILNYSIPNEHLRLTKNEDYNSQGPYTNSYHMIDMNFAELSWKRNESEMKFQAAQATAMGNAWFESWDFYNDAVFNSMQTVLEYSNPLAELWAFSKMIQSDVFAVTSYASYKGSDPSQERHRFMELSRLGFIYFNFEKDEITVRAKLYDYIDAFRKQRDYDVIRFRSNTTSGLENASLDLLTKDLTINGIPNIFLSDSQNVMLVPSNNQIIMKRNRNFQFDGAIDAGLFKFYGQNFFFEYDYFLINLQNIDSLSISAKTGERSNYGEDLLVNIDNKIENITGELLIDAPFNKSGLENYPDYPVFTSRENSYIYFDEKKIQDGIYDRDRFYFELEPFSIDSLDNFTRVAMRMEGTFVSANIMPPMKMEMSLRPDNSLGFYMSTPEEGLELFNGKAIFYNDIEMSSAGLHGYGSMDYLTSTTWSDDFLFHPDSITTTSREFLEREKLDMTSYPLVKNSVVKISLIPDEDVMNIKKEDELFTMFGDNTKFSGDLYLRPTGLSGSGSVGLADGVVESGDIKFEAKRIYADSAGVKVRPGMEGEFTLLTNNVAVDIDLNKREGSLVARADYTLIEFPANLYEANLDRVDWFMERDEVRLTQQKQLPENQIDIGVDSLKVNGPTYLSRQKDQDSLNFVAPLAIFNYRDKKIIADDVLYINVADALIFPSQGDVEIMEYAKMSPLNMARILADKTTKYHNLYDAHVVIESRNYYKGSGMYDYVDEYGTIYPFLLSEVEVDNNRETRGVGKIDDSDEFYLSPFMEFQGEINLNAQSQFLNFSGGVRLPHTCDVDKQWMKFETYIRPDSIRIPVVRSMMNYEMDPINASPMVARDSTHIYPAFLSKRKGPYDKNMITPAGNLSYDKQNQDYIITREDKLNDMTLEGNYLRFETDSCRLYGEGLLDMKLDFGRVEMKTAGEVVHKVDENKMDLRMLLGLNFFFSDPALKIFAAEIDSLADLDPVNLSSSFYQVGMKNFVGTEMADQLDKDLGLLGTYGEIPKELDYQLFFNDVPLQWNQETNSFRYSGKIGIGIVGGVQINKKVDAYIEFVDKGSDIFDIYLKADSKTWYYFAYSNGVMQALSSNPLFNSSISEIKTSKRKLKAGKGEASYVYSEASPQRLGRFISKFEFTESDDGAVDDF